MMKLKPLHDQLLVEIEHHNTSNSMIQLLTKSHPVQYVRVKEISDTYFKPNTTQLINVPVKVGDLLVTPKGCEYTITMPDKSQLTLIRVEHIVSKVVE